VGHPIRLISFFIPRFLFINPDQGPHFWPSHQGEGDATSLSIPLNSLNPSRVAGFLIKIPNYNFSASSHIPEVVSMAAWWLSDLSL
jgi:hypothetical protein